MTEDLKGDIDAARAIAVIDALVNHHTGQHLSSVQVIVLREAWQGSRKTYKQLAEETQYSPSYIQQGVAPKLWRLLSKITSQKVTKGTVKTTLSQYLRQTDLTAVLNENIAAIAPAEPQAALVPLPLNPAAEPPPTTGLNDRQTVEASSSSSLRDTVNQSLASSIGQRMHSPPGSAADQRPPSVKFVPSGHAVALKDLDFPEESVPLNSPFYVERGTSDRRCYEEIMVPGCLIRIKGPRQMGKSSLLNRVLDHAQRTDCKTAILHFQQAESTVLADTNRLLRWICANLSMQLGLVPQLDQYWDEDLGSKMSCNLFLQAHILPQCEGPLVVAFEEVNELLAYPEVAKEFLTLLRFWHERAKLESQWRSLRLIMVHSTDIYISLDVNQSPLNVGLSILLKSFTEEQVDRLAQRHGFILPPNIITQLQNLLGGHPYLTRLTLYQMVKDGLSVEDVLQEAATDTGIYRSHLHRHLDELKQYPALGQTFGKILIATDPITVDQIHGFKLQSLGLVNLEKNHAMVSCSLYRQYFGDRINDFVYGE